MTGDDIKGDDHLPHSSHAEEQMSEAKALDVTIANILLTEKAGGKEIVAGHATEAAPDDELPWMTLVKWKKSIVLLGY